VVKVREARGGSATTRATFLAIPVISEYFKRIFETHKYLTEARSKIKLYKYQFIYWKLHMPQLE